VSYSTGEIGGIARFTCRQGGYPLLLVNPRQLKSFALPQKKVSKDDIMDVAKRDFGFESLAKRKSDRQDETDAFMLAIIGEFFGDVDGDVDRVDAIKDHRSKVIGVLRDPKKNLYFDWKEWPSVSCIEDTRRL